MQKEISEYAATLPHLSDEVIGLRNLRESDFDRLIEICRDPITQLFTEIPASYGVEQARTFLSELVVPDWAAKTRAYWAITVADKLVGGIDIQNLNTLPSLGYVMHPDARGRGYCPRAIKLVVAAAYHHFNLTVLRWQAADNNSASLAAAQKAGLVYEGRLHFGFLLRGKITHCHVGYFEKCERLGS